MPYSTPRPQTARKRLALARERRKLQTQLPALIGKDAELAKLRIQYITKLLT